MKTISHILAVTLVCFFIQFSQAQKFEVNINEKIKLEEKIKSLEKQISIIEEKEKELLKEEVEAINTRLANEEITAEEAQKQKEEASKKRAMNIENQVNIINEQIVLIKRNLYEIDGEQYADEYYSEMEYMEIEEENLHAHDTVPKRTTSNMTIAFGFSNTLSDERSLDDSPYKIGGSRFFEIGYEFQTLLTESGFARLRYGLVFQFDGLKADNNQYFVDNGETTSLEDFSFDTKKAKLRLDNLVVPIHLELGKMKHKALCGKEDCHTFKPGFKIGLGGFAGINLNTVQKIKFEDADGNDQKQRFSYDYNTSNFLYGLSAYIGYDKWAFYTRYNLNTVFTDNVIDEQMVAVGLRLSY